MRLKLLVQKYEQRVNDSNVSCDKCHGKIYFTNNANENLYVNLSFQSHKGNQLRIQRIFSHLQKNIHITKLRFFVKNEKII